MRYHVRAVTALRRPQRPVSPRSRSRPAPAAPANPAGFVDHHLPRAVLARTPTSFRGRDLHQPALEIQVRPTQRSQLTDADARRPQHRHGRCGPHVPRLGQWFDQGLVDLFGGAVGCGMLRAPRVLSVRPGPVPHHRPQARAARSDGTLRGRHVGQRRGQLKVGRVVVHVEASQPAEVVAQRRAAQTGRLPMVAERQTPPANPDPPCLTSRRPSQWRRRPATVARFAAPTGFEPVPPPPQGGDAEDAVGWSSRLRSRPDVQSRMRAAA